MTDLAHAQGSNGALAVLVRLLPVKAEHLLNLSGRENLGQSDREARNPEQMSETRVCRTPRKAAIFVLRSSHDELQVLCMCELCRGIENDLDASVGLVDEHVVSARRVAERDAMRDHEARVDVA